MHCKKSIRKIHYHLKMKLKCKTLLSPISICKNLCPINFDNLKFFGFIKNKNKYLK